MATVQGAEETLRTSQPALYVELERRHGTSTDDVLNYLESLGYRVARLAGGNYVADERFHDRFRRELSAQSSSVNVTLLPQSTSKHHGEADYAR